MNDYKMPQSVKDALADAASLREAYDDVRHDDVERFMQWQRLAYASSLPYNLLLVTTEDAAFFYGVDCAKAAFRAVPGLRAPDTDGQGGEA